MPRTKARQYHPNLSESLSSSFCTMIFATISALQWEICDAANSLDLVATVLSTTNWKYPNSLALIVSLLPPFDIGSRHASCDYNSKYTDIYIYIYSRYVSTELSPHLQQVTQGAHPAETITPENRIDPPSALVMHALIVEGLNINTNCGEF